uniref:Fas ligand (TNF superfamily, member 6) n=1 Tax=Iconisemion striatum TaxID=60296 RepID=A0A1A7Y023_9TELE
MEPETLLLIGVWKPGGEMELDNVYRPETYRLVPGQLRSHRTPGQRTNRLVVVCLLVLIVEVLHTTAPVQSVVQPDSSSLGKLQQVSSAPENDSETPRAMLTAPHTDSCNKHLQWESNMGNAFCEGGFYYTDGHLVVPRAGYYSVFLQITYGGDHENGNDTDCGNKETLRLSQSVLYIDDGYPEYRPLLSAVDTVMHTRSWSKSLYTSGLFHLEGNGRLKVESKQHKHIMRNEDQVFFGAELRSDSG